MAEFFNAPANSWLPSSAWFESQSGSTQLILIVAVVVIVFVFLRVLMRALGITGADISTRDTPWRTHSGGDY